MVKHLRDRQLADLVSGVVSEQSLKKEERRHLNDCETCRQKQRELANLLAAVEKGPPVSRVDYEVLRDRILESAARTPQDVNGKGPTRTRRADRKKPK